MRVVCSAFDLTVTSSTLPTHSAGVSSPVQDLQLKARGVPSCLLKGLCVCDLLVGNLDCGAAPRFGLVPCVLQVDVLVHIPFDVVIGRA